MNRPLGSGFSPALHATRLGRALTALGLAALLCRPTPAARADDDEAEGEGIPLGIQQLPAKPRTIDVLEFRVLGAEELTVLELEQILTPFVGPGKKYEDLEAARAALEKAYSTRGYQAVSVIIPPQLVKGGVVTLKVTEARIHRLRVHGSRYFLPSEIRREAPSMAEGKVPNIDAMVEDLVVLNQFADRRVTPSLRAGPFPGTVDVDLNVEDTFPLHGSLELNNRYSPNTTPLRLNGSLRYDNLWQLGHSVSVSAQLAPQRLSDGTVFAAGYLARFPDRQWLSVGLNGLIQNSDLSTLGGIAVAGKGRVAGIRFNGTLPGSASFFHSVSAGLDYKHFLEAERNGANSEKHPVTYWPVTAQYQAIVTSKASQTQLAASMVFNIRPWSSAQSTFDDKRYGSSGNFTYFRGSLERTQELPLRLQGYARLQGQFSSTALLSSEQFTIGGAETVRGYLEAQGAGDYGSAITVELRSPDFAPGKPENAWRVHLFFDYGRVEIKGALDKQTRLFRLMSAGAGTRLKLFDHLTGAADVGVPFVTLGSTRAYHPRVTFSVIGEL